MSGPAVTVVDSGGLPVTPVVSGAPVVTAIVSGGVPITLVENGTPFVVEGLTPPVPIWRNGVFVAGNNVFGWGFAIPPIVSAPLGELVDEPYPLSNLIAFWEAPDDSRVIVCFSGDMVEQLNGYTFNINGTVLDVIEGPTYSPENDWTTMFLESFWMTSGSAYIITRVEQ